MCGKKPKRGVCTFHHLHVRICLNHCYYFCLNFHSIRKEPKTFLCFTFKMNRTEKGKKNISVILSLIDVQSKRSREKWQKSQRDGLEGKQRWIEAEAKMCDRVKKWDVRTYISVADWEQVQLHTLLRWQTRCAHTKTARACSHILSASNTLSFLSKRKLK